MSSANNNNSRKRSRWGGGGGESARHVEEKSHDKLPPRGAASGISEEDALQALLSSATAQQEEKEQQQQRKRPERSYDDRNNNRPSSRHRSEAKDGKRKEDDYYGPGTSSSSRSNTKKRDAKDEGAAEDGNEEEPDVDKQKPNFGLSGALAKDSKGGNMYKGVVLKFREPPEARAPNTLWRFYVFKGEEQLDTLHVSRQSAYLFGRNPEIADIVLQHPSSSSQHAVLQYRALPNKDTGKLNCLPYLMDLESTNGSFINGVRIDSARYYQLKKGDVLKFGSSTREYVLLTANTTSVA